MSETLQDRANKFMITEAKAELVSTAKEYGVKLDAGDKTGTMISPDTLKIILPSAMNKLQGALNLIQQYAEEETTRTYNRSYPNLFINDFMAVMGDIIPKYFGMLHVSPVNTSLQPTKPNYIQFPIGFKEDGTVRTQKGYVGSILAPVWENAILDIRPGAIAVRAKLKFEASVNDFLEDVERAIRENSIVKGNPVEITITDNGLIASPIRAKINKAIVLEDKTERIIHNLVIPSLRERSKTSLLFTGDFGTGKTETAIRVGLEGVKRYGRTFFYLENSSKFAPLISHIKNYQPCTVFVEDVDQISSGDRDSSMNNLLNSLDGNELKNVDCTFIFTTNEPDKIHPAMRRPGRIDQVVHFGYCTPEMIAKIFENHAIGMPGAADVDFMEAAKACPDNLQGAIVAEISRRAVKYSNNLYDGVISTDRFLDAIASMENHIKFMRDTQKVDHSLENLMGHVMYKSLKKAFPNIDTANPGEYESYFDKSPYEGLQN